MTVNTTNIVSGPYVGNGLSDTFSYTFRVSNKTQLSVYETTDTGAQTLLTVDTDYTVNDIGVDAGGTIVRAAGNLPTDYQWYIRSNYIENQLTDFSSQGGFFPDVHEAQMDHITFLIQQLRDKLSRSFALNDFIDIDGDLTISDDAAERINKVLGFDVTGDLETVTLNSDFINVYLGAFTSANEPLTDNQGNALIDGALYYNTTNNIVRVYDFGTSSWTTVNPSNEAIDINVTDAGNYFVSNEVESVLQEIMSLAIRPLDINNTEVIVANDATKQAIYSFTVPAGTVKDGDVLDLYLYGNLVNNVGSGQALVLDVDIGATAVATNSAFPSVASSATNRGVIVNMRIAVDAAATSQFVTAEASVGQATNQWGQVDSANSLKKANVAEDFTAAITITFSVNFLLADANLSFTKKHASIVLIPS